MSAIITKNGTIATSGSLDIVAGVDKHLFISSSGNVGIGTASPLFKLQMDGFGLFGIGPNAGVSMPVLSREGTQGGLSIDRYSSTAAYEANLMTILGAGNVGIGTTNPLTKLQLQTVATNGIQDALALNNPSNFGYGQGTASAALLFTRTRIGDATHNKMAQIVGGNEDEQTAARGILFFGTADSSEVMQERMRINSLGNVGIGTISPGSLLHVQGNISASLLLGTASYANMALSASWAPDQTIAVVSASWASSSISSSYATNANTAIAANTLVGPNITVDNNLIPLASEYTVGTSGEPWADMYATTFHGTASLATSASYVNGKVLTNDITASNGLIVSNGNVGIGTTSPQGKLDIFSSTNAATMSLLSIRSDFHTVGNYGMIKFGDYTQTTDYQKGAIIYEGVHASARGKFHIALNNDDTAASVALTDARLTVQSDGNVGIGTSDPQAKLHVQGNISCSLLLGTASYALNGGGSGGTTLTTGSTYPITSSWAVRATNLAYTDINSTVHLYIGNGAGTNIPQDGVKDGDLTIIGINAGTNATNAQYATIIGNGAGYNSNYIPSATIVGSAAGYRLLSASYATIVGREAGYYALMASGSTMIGGRSGYYAASTLNSTFIGHGADVVSGSNNITNSIAIGYNAKVSGSNMCVIGGTGADAMNLMIAGYISASSVTASLKGNASSATTANTLTGPNITVNNDLIPLAGEYSIGTSGQPWSNMYAETFHGTADTASYSPGSMPVGAITAWYKGQTGVPALSSNWVECNGQTLSDAGSPMNGTVIPNLNSSNLFLRGNTTSSGSGGSATHEHSTFTAQGATGTDINPIESLVAASNIPPYMDVLWIMRIK